MQPITTSNADRLMVKVKMKKPEYREGPEVAREFEEAMKIVFQTPKPERENLQPKASKRENDVDDKD